MKFFFRIPVYVYALRMGRFFGKQFLLLQHIGRSSNKIRKTVLEVVDVVDGAPIVISGFGSKSDWLLNMKKNPSVIIQWGDRRFNSFPIWLKADEVTDILNKYQLKHKFLVLVYEKMFNINLNKKSEYPLCKFPILYSGTSTK
jgi:deazaflavin-dependent oxidoreductase (nitroreductase family)|tara:strand:+ start:1164 stop:1592 length:429 start_codon:yes stop_codon:yes gene_type:complete